MKADPELTKRNETIRREYLKGESDSRLAEKYGVSRQRINQIVGRGASAERRARRKHKKELHAAELAQTIDLFKKDREVKLFEGVRCVATGMSIRFASRLKGVPLAMLGARCKEAGVETRFGKWRDRSKVKAFVETLIADGEKVSYIPRRVAEIGEQISEGWIYQNCYPSILKRQAANDNTESKAA